MNWSVRPDKKFRLALGSFVEEYNNKVRFMFCFIHIVQIEKADDILQCLVVCTENDDVATSGYIIYEVTCPVVVHNYSILKSQRVGAMCCCNDSMMKMIFLFMYFQLFCLHILQVQIVQLDEETSDFACKATFEHPYPTTKIVWIPDTVSLSLQCLHKTFLCHEVLVLDEYRKVALYSSTAKW